MNFQNKFKLIFRWILGLFVLVVAGGLLSKQAVKFNLFYSYNDPITIYSTLQNDKCDNLIYELIKKTQNHLFIKAYSISDKKFIKEINKATERGCETHIVHDSSVSTKGISPLVSFKPYFPKSNKMHEKIIVSDREDILLGTGNFTKQSLIYDGNLFLGLNSEGLANSIINNKGYFNGVISGQRCEYFSIPQHGMKCVNTIRKLIRNASYNIKVAMFAFSYEEIAQELINAKKRGVNVEVILDKAAIKGCGKNVYSNFLKNDISPKIGKGAFYTHYKIAVIDDKVLIFGSVNWSNSGFKNNSEYELFLYDLTKIQICKINSVWRQMLCVSE